LRDGAPNGQADGTVFNGSLRKLKELLRQAAGRGGGAEVLLEVHQAGRVVVLRVQGLRVTAEADLPRRIETVLDQPGCCEFVGPPKLARGPGFAAMQHDERAAQVRLAAPVGNNDEEFCASIDRY